jgi:perosamine synthetase
VSSPCETGAAPPPGEIPLSVPNLAGREWEFVKECLDTNFVSSVGPFVERFEREVAHAVGTRHAVACVNGTAALHIALLVAGVQPDDEVLMPGLTFVAPANAIRYVGAWPVFIDVEAEYWQIDVAKLAAFLDEECRIEAGVLRNRSTRRRVAAVLPVDILGHSCDIAPILDLAQRYGLTVIEDATESLGARYHDKPVGSHAPIACFSFNGNKIITTGGGGMIVTDDDAWARRARYLTTQAKDDPIESVHNEIGFNYRLTNVLAALGCAQLANLDVFVGTKRRIAASYTDALSSVPGIRPMREPPHARSTFWLYTVLIDASAFGRHSRTVMRDLAHAGIQTRPLWCPLHRLPPYRGAQAYRMAEADRLYDCGLSLPSSTSLTDTEQDIVIRQLTGPHGA